MALQLLDERGAAGLGDRRKEYCCNTHNKGQRCEIIEHRFGSARGQPFLPIALASGAQTSATRNARPLPMPMLLPPPTSNALSSLSSRTQHAQTQQQHPHRRTSAATHRPTRSSTNPRFCCSICSRRMRAILHRAPRMRWGTMTDIACASTRETIDT